MAMRSTILLFSLLTLAACSKVNQENYAKLSAGMSQSEVEALLGNPSACSGAVGLASCTWGDDESSVRRAKTKTREA